LPASPITVVARAAHFSRGVTAGLAQNHIAPEPVIVRQQTQPVLEKIDEPVVKPVLEQSAGQAKMDAQVEIKPVQQVLNTLNNAAPEAGAESRKAFDSATKGTHPYVHGTTPLAGPVKAQRASNAVTGVSNPSNTLNGWWLWPTLAMLLGMGFAAYMLYLYSMSFTS
jgi:hypothetical protein